MMSISISKWTLWQRSQERRGATQRAIEGGGGLGMSAARSFGGGNRVGPRVERKLGARLVEPVEGRAEAQRQRCTGRRRTIHRNEGALNDIVRRDASGHSGRCAPRLHDVSVTWPAEFMSEFAVWMRELLR